jgi:ubiquinone/menaquinone biosynthesis C-methylase UbiE
MQHHLNDDNKQKAIKEANRVLKDWGLFLILDTFEPKSKNKKAIFKYFVEQFYQKLEWTWPYYTEESDKTISRLKEAWFEILSQQWYKMWLWRLLQMDLTTQIIAIKVNDIV